MNDQYSALYPRMRRRETHSPRSFLAIVLAVVLVLVCVWFGAEIVLRMLRRGPLVASPETMMTTLVGVPELPAVTPIAIGVVTTLVGVALVITALTLGRRARHVLGTERTVTVVGDEVIAAALAHQASRAGNIDPANAHVTVSLRRVAVTLTPTSGMPPDVEHVTNEIEGQLTSYALDPPARVTLTVDERGKVGS